MDKEETPDKQGALTPRLVLLVDPDKETRRQIKEELECDDKYTFKFADAEDFTQPLGTLDQTDTLFDLVIFEVKDPAVTLDFFLDSAKGYFPKTCIAFTTCTVSEGVRIMKAGANHVVTKDEDNPFQTLHKISKKYLKPQSERSHPVNG